ncbi:MAG TPA: phosphoglycerate kinase [Patescibacteria group bacterium]|nr:phosphoglycerate kinase [Patescibacteria group bacterium]
MAFNKKTIKDIDVNGKTVLVRTSLNVPIEHGKVMDELRLSSAVPTIDYLRKHGAKLVLMSHHSSEGQSLAPVAPVLAKLLDHNVQFLPDCIGPKVEAAVKNMKLGDVIMLENLRFHKEEEANNPEFAKKLADLGDIYVDDDFTTTHREHASIVGIPKLLPGVAGLQIELEVDTITKAMQNPKRPLLVVVGGAKISTKIDFLNNFLNKAQALFIGGAMANTFLAASGLEVGKSLVEKSGIPTAQKVTLDAKKQGVSLYTPIDVVVTDSVDQASNVETVTVDNVGPDQIIADVGPKSVERVQEVLDKGGTVIWNGPLGIEEKPAFRKASQDLARRIIASSATSIIGGGDTASFIDSEGLHDKFSFVSTGGGASLELMSGKKLPGVEALQDK